MPVIFFHAGFQAFSGGFVGVDVFFVISGYLITSLILAEHDAGTFTLTHFYERRARRILPALFVVMLVCLPFAWAWLLPGDMRRFSQSLVAITGFSSNLFFWLTSDYFDTLAELKPLLHTWSLSVEEQYYLVFPFMLIVTWRLGRKLVIGLLAIAAVSSLAAAQWGSIKLPVATFFLLPTRLWELLIGGFIAFYFETQRKESNSRRNIHTGDQNVRQFLSVAGLCLIIYSIFTFSKSTPFPSLYALIPTIGATLIILFGTPATVVGRILCSKPFVGVGLISYSAYLWHQPIFAFARLRSPTELSTVTLLGLSLATLIFAYFSWRFIEKPFRRRRYISRGKVVLFAVAGGLLFLAIGLAGHIKDGFPNRFLFVTETFGPFELDNAKLREESWNTLKSINGKDYSNLNDLSDQHLRFSQAKNTTKVLIIGNSHSKDLFNMFAENQALFPRFEFSRFGIEISCLVAGTQNNRFFDSPDYRAANVILVSTRWIETGCNSTEKKDGVFDAVEYLASLGRRDGKLVVLTSNTLEFPTFGYSLIADALVLQATKDRIQPFSQEGKERLAFAINHRYFELKDSLKYVRSFNRKVQKVAIKNDLVFLDKEEYLCDKAKSICFGITENFKKSFYDYGHYTLDGAKEFGRRAASIGWLRPIENATRKGDY